MVLAIAALSTLALAQRESGVRESRDGREVMVNKDVGDERWAIAFDLDSGTVTGNVFYQDGRPPSYVWCSPAGSPGRIEPGAPDLTLTCYGSDECTSAPCDPSNWEHIANVRLPVSFFLTDDPNTVEPTPEPTRVAPTPAPTAQPTPAQTPAPTPAPTAAPTAQPTPPPTPSPSPSPSPVPTPSPSPSPSPIPGPSILIDGVAYPQANCRNGVIDSGEECDDGSANYECVYDDPDYQAECGSGAPPSLIDCAYCANTFSIGPPLVSPPPCSGSERLVKVSTLAETVCDTIDGPEMTCSVNIGGHAPPNPICLQVAPLVLPSAGDPGALAEGFRESHCYSNVCIPVANLIGTCSGQNNGTPCTLMVNGQPAAGTCQGQRSGNAFCFGATVDLL